MGRSLAHQVKGVWAAARILRIGKSRFQDKQDVRDQLRAEGIGATAARIAERTPIASYRTFSAYRAVSLAFAHFAAVRGVQRVQDLRPEHAEAFMRTRLAAGCSCNTLRTYAAALGKFDVALSRAPKAMHIPDAARLSPGIEAVRRDFNHEAPRLDQDRRAYADPHGLVRAVQGEGHRLAARLQLGAGFRVSEVLGLNRASLQGETRDPVSGRWCGLVEVVGKGGFGRVQYVPLAEYRALASHLEEHRGGLAVQYKPYLADLHRAADAVGEAWAGTHALRHNYVRAFLVEAAGAGLGADAMMREAMARVGHHRMSEVRTYCR